MIDLYYIWEKKNASSISIAESSSAFTATVGGKSKGVQLVGEEMGPSLLLLLLLL